MDNIDTWINIIDLVALPLVVLVVLILFFTAVVRPFFAFLFDKERVEAVARLGAHKRKGERPGRLDEESAVDDRENNGAAHESAASEEDASVGVRPTGEGAAAVDHERAGDMVKQWIRQDRH